MAAASPAGIDIESRSRRLPGSKIQVPTTLVSMLVTPRTLRTTHRNLSAVLKLCTIEDAIIDCERFASKLAENRLQIICAID